MKNFPIFRSINTEIGVEKKCIGNINMHENDEILCAKVPCAMILYPVFVEENQESKLIEFEMKPEPAKPRKDYITRLMNKRH